jgi:hypothetical protein
LQLAAVHPFGGDVKGTTSGLSFSPCAMHKKQSIVALFRLQAPQTFKEFVIFLEGKWTPIIIQLNHEISSNFYDLYNHPNPIIPIDFMA